MEDESLAFIWTDKCQKLYSKLESIGIHNLDGSVVVGSISLFEVEVANLQI